MKHETVHKKIKLGSLVKVKSLASYGIVTKLFNWWQIKNCNEICYTVFVKGREVRASEEVLIVIGDL
jgi:hypothetical protein